MSTDSEENLCTDVEATNAPIEALLQAEHARATKLLDTHRGALLALVDELLDQGQVTPARFAAVVGLPLGKPEDALDPYAHRLAAFRVEGPALLKAYRGRCGASINEFREFLGGLSWKAVTVWQRRGMLILMECRCISLKDANAMGIAPGSHSGRESTLARDTHPKLLLKPPKLIQ